MTKKLKMFINGQGVESNTNKYVECFNPATGEVIALAPEATVEEVEMAVQAAKAAFPEWANTPVVRRIQVLFNMRNLIDKHLEELVTLVCTENGKCWEEGMGDVLKGKEVIEFACGAPHLMKGDTVMNITQGYDTIQIKESVGVFLGICPWNFPAMIPVGWMAPLCIATGNTMIIKPANEVPQSALRLMDLWTESGLPKGVLNVITCGNEMAEYLVKHPDVKGITFVGSTSVGKHVYATAAAAGKRVQALCEAKNHALVLNDCNLEMAASGIINATYGCAGERCMALPVVVVQEDIANALVEKLKEKAMKIKVGHGCDKSSLLGPVINAKHMEFVKNWIQKGVEEGANLVLDGRNVKVKGYENGFFIGPTIFDYVKPGMTVGEREIFGSVICIKRVKTFEEGITLMNDIPFANGSVIYTQSGYFAREFAKRTHAGMVGINVGTPVPVGIFGFTGHKNSFFGDLHVMGTDGVRFYTQLKSITTQWFTEATRKKVDTWDGMLDMQEKK
ncbi:MAG TPA: methylmalonate-semialdehyde dehydrogenase (CoA acylating) [Lentisphaeria bacterium]|nr:MAG: methylmalonate-semialdehyde dehydrogenase (acylating) [Lentisphaerae bacterium GWF2_38_69]HBM16443.1 methylmalonate-semialdehyde dehydrogenase (CoA acylating) [Lentisphaeria bacterium]